MERFTATVSRGKGLQFPFLSSLWLLLLLLLYIVLAVILLAMVDVRTETPLNAETVEKKTM